MIQHSTYNTSHYLNKLYILVENVFNYKSMGHTDVYPCNHVKILVTKGFLLRLQQLYCLAFSPSSSHFSGGSSLILVNLRACIFSWSLGSEGAPTKQPSLHCHRGCRLLEGGGGGSSLLFLPWLHSEGKLIGKFHWMIHCCPLYVRSWHLNVWADVSLLL